MNRRRKFKSPRICIFPGYNWCGPGCQGPGKPINRVDAACKKHDLCYQSHKSRCQCDKELYQQLERYTQENSLEGRHARIISRYMKAQSAFTCKFH
ncbi:phospholipase [Sporosarcina oncorhynchi]|uniref:Phospholipase n=1 Tax=Sporosarcina oncorhynchi TaxID=3056444 RepID=A0ABZ0L6K3_9BACL|nr:phospholipase [Sporosarcina sp. T2O-4]WOV88192.1 phospholipase [Sporosarcina sp. T2O-4]